MTHPQAFETLKMVAQQLDAHQVDWLVFAGAAAAVHGAERAITDVDVLVPMDQGDEVARILPLAASIRIGEGCLLSIELPGVDIIAGLGLFDIDGEMLSRARRHEIGGLQVPVIPVEDNVLVKAMMGRGADEGKHDWEDVAAMLAHNPDLDWDYLLWRANEVPDQARVDEVIARLRGMR